MSNDSNKFQVFNILAACILGASLIASAQIVAHRLMPPAAGPSTNLALEAAANASNASTGAKALASPPLAQEAVQKQFREQVLAAPRLHTYRHQNKKYTLVDVKVTQVIYSAKQDEFLVRFEWVWQEGSPLGREWSSAASLSNDGYGHYFGTVSLGSMSQGSGQSADVTIG